MIIGKERVEVYDNNGETIDRYTVVFLNWKRKDIYDCLAVCANGGKDFSQFSTCNRGSHLGKKIRKLPTELLEHLKERLL